MCTLPHNSDEGFLTYFSSHGLTADSASGLLSSAESSVQVNLLAIPPVETGVSEISPNHGLGSNRNSRTTVSSVLSYQESTASSASRTVHRGLYQPRASGPVSRWREGTISSLDNRQATRESTQASIQGNSNGDNLLVADLNTVLAPSVQIAATVTHRESLSAETKLKGEDERHEEKKSDMDTRSAPTPAVSSHTPSSSPIRVFSDEPELFAQDHTSTIVASPARAAKVVFKSFDFNHPKPPVPALKKIYRLDRIIDSTISTSAISANTGDSEYATRYRWTFPEKRALEIRDAVRQLTFSPDGDKIASCSSSGHVKIWEIMSAESTAIFDFQFSPSYRTIVSPDLGEVTCSTRSGRLTSYPIGDMNMTREKWWAIAGGIDFTYSPNGSCLAYVNRSGAISFIDSQDKCETNLPPPREGYLIGQGCLRFSLQGDLIAHSNNGKVAIVSLFDGSILQRIDTPNRIISFLAFSPDGESLAICFAGGSLQVWSIATGEPLFEIEDAGPHVDFSLDGTLLAACHNTVVRLYDGLTGGVLQVLYHKTRVRALTFSPVGEWLASGTDDGEIRIWGAV